MFYLLAQSPNLVTPANSDWRSIIFAVAFSLLSLAISFWYSRRKQKTDDFSTFMQQSSDFREEIRTELKRKEEEFNKELLACKLIISERDKLLEAAKMEKMLLNNMPQLIWYATPEGKYQFFNYRWYEYSGLNFEQSIEHGWLDVIHPDDKMKAKSEWEHAITVKRSYESRYLLRKNDTGEYKLHLLKVIPVFDDHGRIAQWLGTYTDISNLPGRN